LNFAPNGAPCRVRFVKNTCRAGDEVARPLLTDTVEKGFFPFERERLIQDRAPVRNVDSRMHFA
jgi:hypothetical protein